MRTMRTEIKYLEKENKKLIYSIGAYSDSINLVMDSITGMGVSRV